MSLIVLGLTLSFSREYDVRRGRRRHMLGARIAQRRQVHPRKERLTTAEQDRRDRDMHLVDEPRLEILAHRGRPAADLDIEPDRGLPGATERFLDSAGDEMKDGATFHRDRFARVVREHEHRHVIRRVLAPPAAPPVVGPRPAHGAEHVSAHDIRTDAFPEALRKNVVGARRPARLPVHLAKRARADVPAVQLLTTHAEWVLQSLAGAGAVPFERDREVVDAQFGHGILRWFHMRRMGRPEIDRRRMSWGPDSARVLSSRCFNFRCSSNPSDSAVSIPRRSTQCRRLSQSCPCRSTATSPTSTMAWPKCSTGTSTRATSKSTREGRTP